MIPQYLAKSMKPINYFLNFCCLNTTTIKTHSHFTVQQMSLLVLQYYNALHVSAPKAILRRYDLTNILKLFNYALYMVPHNLNTYYHMCLVSYLVNIFNHISKVILSHIK
jgi:hypothetical protein